MQQLTQNDIQRVREELLLEQSGICPICKSDCRTPVLDHEHKKGLKGSGLIRGVLCSSHNVFLGKIENNCRRYGISLEELPNVLRNIADYLEAPHKPYIHPSERPKKKILLKSSFNRLISAIKKSGCEKDIKKIPNYTGNVTKLITEMATKYNIELIVK